ncbi:hypothetical protein AK812_SmicGene10941 [Symbiodinium microadriaticum]|uniref:Uncharacterized protein n=1 Tax=Symbiodinium microadriaticum TaxID=2951 RepID=A0A1Q9EEG8_SYMMI|nr:hypothetical protein AK812_SmicGene10941 [Symbiodinium microadriaticum]
MVSTLEGRWLLEDENGDTTIALISENGEVKFMEDPEAEMRISEPNAGEFLLLSSDGEELCQVKLVEAGICESIGLDRDAQPFHPRPLQTPVLQRHGACSRFDMPKVSLASARARDSEILEKLGKVQQAAESHKQQTKLHQQRHEWIEQARSLQRDSRRLEEELTTTVAELGLWPDLEAEVKASADATAEVWSQVSGLRQLLAALRRRDAVRLRQSPQQAVDLQAVLSTMAAALQGVSPQLAQEAAAVEADCARLRGELRREMAAENAWATERKPEDRCDLSDEEDLMLEQADDEDYAADLAGLNAQIRTALSQLEEEMADLRHRRGGWDDEAHFRFLHIKQQFQGRGRELFTERLRLEFPHLTREQLYQHEATCDGLKFTSQRQAAAFRQWRRERLTLLRRHQQRFAERRRASELLALKKQEMMELRAKGKVLQGRLEVDRAKASAKREVGEEKEQVGA